MKTILVIEDDAAIRSMLARALTFAGHEVVTAASGAEGEKLLNTRPTDLVVTDIIMPDVDGLEFIFRARKHREVPLVALSGGGRVSARQYLEMARLAGAAATFEKPLDLEKFVKTINDLLESKIRL